MGYTIRKSRGKSEYCIFAKDGKLKGCRKSAKEANELRKQILRAHYAEKANFAEGSAYTSVCIAMAIPDQLANELYAISTDLGLWLEYELHLTLAIFKQVPIALLEPLYAMAELALANWSYGFLMHLTCYAELDSQNLLVAICDAPGLAELRSELLAIGNELGLEDSIQAQSWSYLPHITLGQIDAISVLIGQLPQLPQDAYLLSNGIFMADGYSNLLFKEPTAIPPKHAQAVAKRFLAIRAKLEPSHRCCTLTGMARANQLAQGKPLSLSTLKRMRSYLQRAKGQLTPAKAGDEPSKSEQAFMAWGSKPGDNRLLNWLDKTIARLEQ